MHQSFATTAPRPSGGRGEAEQMSQVFYFYIEFDEFDIPRQTWQCNIKHTRLRGKTVNLLSRSAGVIAGTADKSLSHCCPQDLGKVVITDDWYITIDLFPAYKKQKCGYHNVQTCSMVSIYVSTAWICFIILICMNTLCKREEVD